MELGQNAGEDPVGLPEDPDFAEIRTSVRRILESGRVKLRHGLSKKNGYDLGPTTSRANRLQWNAFGTLLMRETIRYANTKIPFYEKLYNKNDVSFRDFRYMRDIQKFPIFSKELILSETAPVFNPSIVCAGFRQTSGTTIGRSFNVPYTEEELQYNRLLTPARSETTKALHLSVNHMSSRIRSGKEYLSDALHRIELPYLVEDRSQEARAAQNCLQVLSSRYRFPGLSEKISVMSCSPSFILKSLTEFGIATGFDWSSIQLDLITATGYPISAAEQLRFEEIWRSKIRMSFSCAEINGKALQLDHNYRHFRFDRAVHAEILDVETLNPVSEGQDGLLVLTSLYPFQMAQPLIRYWGGDLASLVSLEGTEGEPGPIFAPIGRAANSVDLRSLVPTLVGRRFFGAIDLIEVFGDLGEFSGTSMDRLSIGCIDGVPPVLRVDMEITLRSERNETNFKRLVKEKILDLDADWRRACIERLFEIEVGIHAPETLKEYMRLKAV